MWAQAKEGVDKVQNKSKSWKDREKVYTKEMVRKCEIIFSEKQKEMN